jgi:LppX_LprAFG lipoprotein
MRVRNMAAVAAIAALALAGCGGTGNEGATGVQTTTTQRSAAEKALAEAARKTLAKGTARYSLDLLTNVEGLPPSSARGTGSIDFKHSCSRLDMTMDASGHKLTFSVIYDHGVLYEKLPPELGGAGSRPWIKLDLSEVLGSRTSTGAQLNAGDPGGIVTFLYGAGGITQAGTEMVRGVATTHYKGNLDPRRAAQQLPPDYRDRYMKTLEATGATGPMPADLWIDGKGMIRRIQLSGRATVQGKQSTTRTTIEYFDFGAPVDIKLPPASQVR